MLDKSPYFLSHKHLDRKTSSGTSGKKGMGDHIITASGILSLKESAESLSKSLSKM